MPKSYGGTGQEYVCTECGYRGVAAHFYCGKPDPDENSLHESKAPTRAPNDENRRVIESRKDNEARLRPWPEELSVENVAAWTMANAVVPSDAWPILLAMQDVTFRIVLSNQTKPH